MSVTSRPITPPISALSSGKCVQPSTSVSTPARRSGSRYSRAISSNAGRMYTFDASDV